MLNKFLILISILIMIRLDGIGQEANNSSWVFETDNIIHILNQVNNYQKENPGLTDDRNWERATYYTGVMAFYNATRDERLLDQALNWAESHNWKVGTEWMFPANRYTCVQTYLEIFFHTLDTSQIYKAWDFMDSEIVRSKPTYLSGWYYVDALYVGPPAFVMMSKATGDSKYSDYINPVYWEIANQLYEPEIGLFYRDSKARFEEQSENGKSVIWSRGNGWAMASIPRIMTYLPQDNPYNKKYKDLLIKMANELINRQGEDGFWRPNLDDPLEYPMPESSGTAFFTYAIAWGINHGILDEAIFKPVVEKAWKGLCSVVDEEGKVGWGQLIGRGPSSIKAEDTGEYVSGAFLLAGSEVLKMYFQP